MNLLFCTIVIGLLALCSIEDVRSEEDALLDEIENMIEVTNAMASDPKVTLEDESTDEQKAEMLAQLQKLIDQIEQMGNMLAQKHKEAEEEEAKRLLLEDEEIIDASAEKTDLDAEEDESDDVVSKTDDKKEEL